MSFNPKVSIIIPVFNGSNFLRQAIDSALDQSYENCEIIVVNDGSIDDGATEKIALSYEDKIRYFHKENGGVSSALNLGIEKMAGEYFSWLSHDDLYLPHKIQTQMDYLRNNAKNVILYSDFDVIDSESGYLKTKREAYIPPDKFKLHLMISHPINGCTALIPKCFLLEVGFFDESLKTVQDYDLWYRLSGKFDFVHQPEVLVKFRHHDAQGSISSRSLCIKECTNFYSACFSEMMCSYDALHSNIPFITYCIRSSIFFSRIGCPESAKLAIGYWYNRKRQNYKMGEFLLDLYWSVYYILFKIKNSIF